MDRKELALECKEVERCGGNVLDFLREQGAVTPWGTWFRLQKDELHRKESQIRGGKNTNMAKKAILTPEAREKVEKMIEAGQDPKPFLQEAGSKNPSAHEYMIRKNMEARKAKEQEFHEPKIQEEEKSKETESKAPAPRKKKKQTEQTFKIREADGIIGSWRDSNEGKVLFEKDRYHSIELNVDEWLAIMAELPKVLDLFNLRKVDGS